LVVVLMIIGILAAAAAPTFYQSLLYHRVESAARRVKLDIEQLRLTARVKSESLSITFSGSGTYTLSPGVQGLDHPNQSYVVDLAAPPYELDSVTVNFGGPTAVSFDGYGNASDGGTIILTLGDHQRTVVLDQNTGLVTISGN
jgi:type II secretory pathway pseudopilin PulG